MRAIAREDERPEEDSRERPASMRCRRRAVGAFVATLAAFSIGTYLSWTSSGLPLYDGRNGTLSVGEREVSWIACLLPLGAVTMPAATLADKFGRRGMIWATSAVLCLSWYAIGFARSKIWLFLARFAAGAACGVAHLVAPVLASEIAERDCFGGPLPAAVFQSQIAAGILFAYATAFTDSARVIAILCSAAPVLLFISLPLVPVESPTRPVMRGRRSGRRAAEADRLELRAADAEREARRPGISDLRRYPREICIVFGLMVVQQFSGVNALIFYASWILDDANAFPSPRLSSVIVGVAQATAACLSPVLIERAGKKLLLFVSASTMAVCAFTLSGYFHFQRSHDLGSVSWIPSLSLAAFVAAYAVGFGPVPWLMLGELFHASDVRSVASTVAAKCNWTLVFLVTCYFRDTARLLGNSRTFSVFGVFSLIGVVFVSVLVPEGRGSAGAVPIDPRGPRGWGTPEGIDHDRGGGDATEVAQAI